jgi:peptidoglycan/LPS O-acetylase OafA/YrhL
MVLLTDEVITDKLFLMNKVVKDIPKYNYVDALKGLAILGIILVHCQYFAQPNIMMGALIAAGARGVQLFYIISAFTLSLSWQRRSKNESAPVRNFYIRRFFRIAPLFYIALIFYLFVYGFAPRYFAPNGIKWWFIPLSVFFLNGFSPETISSIVPGGWAIAVFASFYLIFPLLMKRIKNINSAVVFFILSLIISWGFNLLFKQLYLDIYPENQKYLVHDFLFLNFFNQLPVFAVGILAFFVYKNRKLLRNVVLFGNIVLVLGLGLLFLLYSPIKAAQLLSNYIAGSIILVLFMLTLSRFPFSLIVNKLSTTLGKISYPMYLSHFSIFALLSTLGVEKILIDNNLYFFSYFLCVAALSGLISYFLHIAVGKKCVLFARNMINKMEAKNNYNKP